MGLMPAHAAATSRVFSLKEIVDRAGDNSGAWPRPAPGGGAPPRRHDREAARDPQRLADHRDPNGGRIRVATKLLARPGVADGRRARLRSPGTVARRRDADRARRSDHPDLEPESVARRGARARDSLARRGLGRGGADGSRHRLHGNVRDASPISSAPGWRPGRTSTRSGRFRYRRSRELDLGTVAAARLFVDRRESTLNESGDFLLAVEERGHRPGAHRRRRSARCSPATCEGRRSDDELTLFKSIGIAVEDLAAAELCVRRARERGIGTEVDF